MPLMNHSPAYRAAALRLVLLIAIAAPFTLTAAEPATLDPNLEPLRPWIGKTWKEQPKEGATNPKTDIARGERALNGKAVRILHSIDNGAYGGESIVMWDAKQRAVVYYYFTTAGFSTAGKMRFEEGKLLTHEQVSGEAGGVSEVRSTMAMQGDGTFRVATEYLKNGNGQPGREAVYREDAAAEVVFK